MQALAVLSDPTRRRIVELLAQRNRTAGEIADHFDLARPGVSRHLRVLREGGLVTASRSGQRRIYRLEPAPLMELEDWLLSLRRTGRHQLDALDTELRRGRRTARGATDPTAPMDRIEEQRDVGA